MSDDRKPKKPSEDVRDDFWTLFGWVVSQL